MTLRIKACMLIAFLIDLSVHGQNLPPIGGWRDHLPYHQGIQVLKAGNAILTTTPYALFLFNENDNSVERISKVNGLSEADIGAVAGDEASSTIVIGYKSGGIDVYGPRGVRYTGELRRSNIPASKQINHIFIGNGSAYLSTDFGLVQLNMDRVEITSTFLIGAAGQYTKVTGSCIYSGYIFAVTGEGLKRARITDNLQDFRSWMAIATPAGGTVRAVVTTSNKLFLQTDSAVHDLSGQVPVEIYRTSGILRTVRGYGERIFVAEHLSTGVRILQLSTAGDTERIISNSPLFNHVSDILFTGTNTYVADSVSGLVRYSTGAEQIMINSPTSPALGEITSSGNNILVARSNETIAPAQTNIINGLSVFEEDRWTNIDSGQFPILSSTPRINAVVRDRNGNTWAGSYGGGLILFAGGNAQAITSPLLQPASTPGDFRVAGLAVDEQQNLWISNPGTSGALVVRKTDGSFHRFPLPAFSGTAQPGKLAIDMLGQKWISLGAGNGMLAFDDGGTIDNPNDDNWKWYRSGRGNGNLPVDDVLSIAVDKDNFVWIGTGSGIAIVQCPGRAFTPEGCDAFIPVVTGQNFNNYLFGDQRINAITVDAANRKWIATNSGAYLVSSDGLQTIHHFTEENSPLPSNSVAGIAIAASTGEVFFSTLRGIVSFRGTATEPAEHQTNVVAYPNPVTPGYTGAIAIKNVPSNSLIKITEPNGRLVYQVRATGSQAIWNGLNSRGGRVSSGVYLVLISSSDNKTYLATKIIFLSQ